MLTSLQNSLVKEIKKLHQPKGRREQGLFLLEGTNVINEACQVNYPLMTVCYTEEWQAKHGQLWELIALRAKRLELVSDRLLQSLATTVSPDGIIATAPKQEQKMWPLTRIGLALETIQDPGNLGTIIRTAAGAGANGLWLTNYSVDMDHPKVLRASAGDWFRLPMSVTDNLKNVILAYQSEGIQVIATVPDTRLTYWEIDWRKPSLVLLGNEGAGLSEELLSLADQRVSIPLSLGVESLNVAIASALILYEAKRQNLSG